MKESTNYLKNFWTYLDQLGEGLIDKNERDQEGEDLLCEAWNKANEYASLEGHGKDNDEHQPETDPCPTRQILDPINFTKLHRNKEETGFRRQSEILWSDVATVDKKTVIID